MTLEEKFPYTDTIICLMKTARKGGTRLEVSKQLVNDVLEELGL